ncbi:hypothetical protein EGW08_000354, partial [Elysia chlorotica]
MGQEEPIKSEGKFGESQVKSAESTGEHGGRTGDSKEFSASARLVGTSPKNNTLLKHTEREAILKHLKSERLHCEKNLSPEKIKNTTAENPTFSTEGRAKIFKRPSSYIHGRVSSPRGSSHAGGLHPKQSPQVETDPATQTLCEDTVSEEERELAALNRINYLNKRLKAKESTRDYFKSLPVGDDHTDMVLVPDPPSWTYESYSGCEKHEATLSGLRSYIRANEGHFGSSEEVSPQESIVSYLDGVISGRYPPRRCSMTLKHYGEGEQAPEGDSSQHPCRYHGGHSARFITDEPHRRRSPSPSQGQRKMKDSSYFANNVEGYAHQDQANNASSGCKSTPPGVWDAKQREPQEATNITDTKESLQTSASALLAKPYIFGKQSRPADQELFTRASQIGRQHVQGVGNLLSHSSRAVLPTVQAQETSLSLEDSCLVSSEKDADLPDMTPGSSPGDAKAARPLIVHSNKTSARIWSSKPHQNLEKQSLHRRSPEDLSKGKNDNGDDELDDEEEEEAEELDDEYSDLIIQTELSEGSMVEVSDSNGPIANIKNGKEDDRKTSQLQVVGFAPNTDEMEILNDEISIKLRDKVPNSGKQQNKRETPSLSSCQDNKANKRSTDKAKQMNSKPYSTKTSARADTRRDRKTPRSRCTVRSSSSGSKNRLKRANESSRSGRAGAASSPPKRSPPQFTESGHGEKADKGQRRPKEMLGQGDINIPTGQDGKTRVLLVLRTPPKKSKDGHRAEEKGERRSPERKNSMPNRPSPRRSPSPRLAHKFLEESFERHSGLSSEIGEIIQSPLFSHGSATELNHPVSPPHARSRGQREGKRFKISSFAVPQNCGQDGFSEADIDVDGEEEIKTIVQNVGDFASVILERGSSDTDSEPVEPDTRAHSPCKYSLYQPCRHEETESSEVRDTPTEARATHTESIAIPQVQRGNRAQDVFNRKFKMENDHGPCSFNLAQPCNHVIHSPCQFDRYKPCRHEECDIAETVPLLSEVSNTRKYEKTGRRTGFVYNSRKLQDKFGHHSACMYDRFKPCLHEELVGPMDYVKNKADISLLLPAAKTSIKHDLKVKKKETNLNLVQCKFDRYTPCYHEDDIRYNKALGMKASLVAGKSKIRHPVPTLMAPDPTADPCRYSPFRPCFCPEKLEASKLQMAEALREAEEAQAAQQLQLGEQETAKEWRVVRNESGLLVTTKVPSKLSEVKERVYVSSPTVEKQVGKSKKLLGNEFMAAPSDGPGLKVKSPSPRAKLAPGGGEGEMSIMNNHGDKMDGEADNAASLSLLGRISRAWFSSTRAQVARLAPPTPVIVRPTLCPEKSLVVTPRSDVLGSPEAAVAGLSAAAETYGVLSTQEYTHPSSCGDGATIPSKHGVNYNACVQTSEEGKDNPFKRQVLHEMSLAESLRTCESLDTDASQRTELPD